MKAPVFGALIGSIVGALISAAVIIALVFFGRLDSIRTLDMLSFALIVVGVVITALTVLGSFTLVNTWNDIDTRAERTVMKYQQQARETLQQQADQATTTLNTITNTSLRRVRNFLLQLGALLIAYLVWVEFRLRRPSK